MTRGNNDSAMDEFQREIYELVESAEAWGDGLGRRFGAKHVERLRGYAAGAADIEGRIIGMGDPAFADLLCRVVRIRANLELLIRKATGRWFGSNLDEALQACRSALAGLEDEEKRAVVTLLMAGIAAHAADGEHP